MLCTFIKYFLIGFVVSVFVSFLSQGICWGVWLIWWGDAGHMPDPTLFAVRAVGIQLVAFVISLIISMIVSIVNACDI
jgi:hypothetical protein